jgi:hypothetical protein
MMLGDGSWGSVTVQGCSYNFFAQYTCAEVEAVEVIAASSGGTLAGPQAAVIPVVGITALLLACAVVRTHARKKKGSKGKGNKIVEDCPEPVVSPKWNSSTVRDLLRVSMQLETGGLVSVGQGWDEPTLEEVDEQLNKIDELCEDSCDDPDMEVDLTIDLHEDCRDVFFDECAKSPQRKTVSDEEDWDLPVEVDPSIDCEALQRPSIEASRSNSKESTISC